jgi:hypothetical protein
MNKILSTVNIKAENTTKDLTVFIGIWSNSFPFHDSSQLHKLKHALSTSFHCSLEWMRRMPQCLLQVHKRSGTLNSTYQCHKAENDKTDILLCNQRWPNNQYDQFWGRWERVWETPLVQATVKLCKGQDSHQPRQHEDSDLILPITVYAHLFHKAS